MEGGPLQPDVKIDIWSDIVCPFCYIGKRHLELALERFEHRDEVEVVWHSFELDPTIEPVADATLVEKIATKYGMSLGQSEASQRGIAERAAEVGLTFNWQDARFGNTFDAHRLVHLAAGHGLADAAHERLMRAYFTEGVAVGDTAELQRLGEEIGLPADEVRELLAGDAHSDAVRADEEQARAYGITGVPFFVLDGKYGVSGAQPVELFEQALAQAWQERSGIQLVTPTGAATDTADGSACGPDGCEI
ncbi:DsbA family oxidoreductase [Actinomycetota bacterium]